MKVSACSEDLSIIPVSGEYTLGMDVEAGEDSGPAFIETLIVFTKHVGYHFCHLICANDPTIVHLCRR